MRTTEFVKEVLNSGFEITERPDFISIYYRNVLISIVSKNKNFLAGMTYESLNDLSEELREKLYNLIDEYVRTPLNERREEKKYYLRLTALIKNEEYNYLNYDDEEEFILGNRIESSDWQTQFTQKEIDEIKENFGVTLNDFKQIPIEEDEEF